MKTGRVRKKETPPPVEQDAPSGATAPARPTKQARPAPRRSARQTTTAPATTSKPVRTGIILGGLFLVLVCLVAVVAILGGGRPKEWVKATQVRGEWTTTVTVLGPQVQVEERWQSDCTAEANATVRSGTCIMKDTQAYQDRPVDQYDEYAYNIYYEETWKQAYEGQGTEFVPIELGSDEWWEGNRHYVSQETIDENSCTWTEYTVWVDDPDDATIEMEAYLAECEVWDQVDVTERVYEQAAWCQCDITTLVEVGRESAQGSGTDIRWPQPSVPAGGRSERSFSGQVTFQGDDYVYTRTTTELDEYSDFFASQYYIGLRNGEAVTVSKNPPQ